MNNLFDLHGKSVVITGAGGLLGLEHAIAIGDFGGLPILVDISREKLETAKKILEKLGIKYVSKVYDLREKRNIELLLEELIYEGIVPTELINNLASNPPMESKGSVDQSYEMFNEDTWKDDLELGLRVAHNCSQVFGGFFAKQGSGSIINVASDLGLIAPDQRIYQDPEITEIDWPIKPVSYSVSKFGIIGLTKYLAAYWGHIPVRVNAVALGSVRSNQSDFLKSQLEMRIPMGRLAEREEYRGLMVFLLSRASSYMTGSVVVADGGRSIW